MRYKVFALFISISFIFTTILSAQEEPSKGVAPPPFRVGIVGLVHGHVAAFLARSVHRPEIQIVGIAESDRTLASRYVNHYGIDQSLLFTDLEEMLKRVHPEAVLAYTNTFDHRKVVEICASHGVHVVMEKPLAVSLDDAHAIERAARNAKIRVLVNYETSWYRSDHAAYELVHEKAIGELRKIIISNGHRGPKEIGVSSEFLSWLRDPELNGAGALFDFGSYGADLGTWLMDGERPETVTAVTQHIKPEVYPHVDDEATIILTYPKAQTILQASWNSPFDHRDVEVYGQTGYVITVRQDQIRIRRAGGVEEQLVAKAIPPPYDDSINYFRAVIRGEIQDEGPSSLETNVIVMEILDAAKQSAASGKTIRISPGE